MGFDDRFPALPQARIGRAPARQAAGARLHDQRHVPAQVGFGLRDVAHLQMDRRNLAVGVELIALGAGTIHFLALAGENLQRALGIARRGILDPGKLHQPSHKIELDRAAAGLKRLVGVCDGVIQAAQRRAGAAAFMVEAGELFAGGAGGRGGVGGGADDFDARRVRLFAVEDGGDVGDGARRRDEGGRCGGRVDDGRGRRRLLRHRRRDVGAAVGGIQRRDHAGANLGGGLLAAGLDAAAAAAHAGLDDRPADRVAAVLDGRFLGQRQPRSCAPEGSQQDEGRDR
jgi:hypothetical protein